MALLCAGSSASSTIEPQTQSPDRQGQRAAGLLSPDEALAGFELEPGYRIELAAAEPLIKDPVAIAFDERGRMYVVEVFDQHQIRRLRWMPTMVQAGSA
jgi:hypothetical protein